jgi:hypothetical protein
MRLRRRRMRTPKVPDSLKVFVRALAARLAPRASRSGKTSATAENGLGLGVDEKAQALLDESKRARFNQRAEDFFRETREGDWR